MKHYQLLLSLLIFSELGFAQDCLKCKMPELDIASSATKLVSDVTAPLDQTSRVDLNFISRVENKSFQHVRPETPDGEPNCVAAALRAGKYLPAFALNGTDSFYERILPLCFSKKEEGKQSPGDLGLFYLRNKKENFETLAHAVVFLDDKTIFEKPSPENKDVFRKNSIAQLKQENSRWPDISLEIWEYSPKKNCPLVAINKKFNSLPSNALERRVAREVEERISTGDWSTPATTFTKKELDQFVKEREKLIEEMIKKIPGGFKLERDYSKLYELDYFADLIKTAQRIPITK